MSETKYPSDYQEWLKLRPAKAMFQIDAVLPHLNEAGFECIIVHGDSFKWKGRLFDGPFCPLLLIRKDDDEAVMLFVNHCCPPVEPFLFELYYLEEFDHNGCRFRASVAAKLFASEEIAAEITKVICVALGLLPVVAAVPMSALGIPLPLPPWIRLYHPLFPDDARREWDAFIAQDPFAPK